MALYSYQGSDYYGTKSKGSLRANSLTEAREMLKKKRIKPTSLVEQEETLANKEIKLFDKVGLKLLVAYLRQFATLISAGITVLDASRMLEEQQKNKKFQQILTEVKEDVDSGKPLSQAFQAHPNAFPILLINIIAVAEMSGSLEQNLIAMADYYEKRSENRSGIISAMIYPIILVLLTIVVSIILLVTIVPMFVEVFESFDSKLPAITVATMAISDFLKTKGIYLAGALICVAGGLQIAKRNASFLFSYHSFLLKLPLFGELLTKNSFSLFMTTLSTLLSSSVPMVAALNMSKEVVSNLAIRKVIADCELKIEEGGKLSDVFRKSSVVPILVIQMVQIGESTGALEDMLAHLSRIYQKEVDETGKRIKTILEPLVILAICIIVGLIVAAVMIPMFSLFSAVQG